MRQRAKTTGEDNGCREQPGFVLSEVGGAARMWNDGAWVSRAARVRERNRKAEEERMARQRVRVVKAEGGSLGFH